jgi:glycosyltransferase involved in cell wall biosynthesis
MVLDRPDLFDPGYALYARLLFGFSVRSADVVLVPSHYSQRCLERRWVNTPPIKVASWPLKPEPRTLDSDLVNRNVLMVGATLLHKRHVLGIAAVEHARMLSGEDIRLTIVGPCGPAENDVSAALRAADPHHKWSERLTAIPQSQLDSMYRNAWLLLQTSQMEGYGLPVGEAAAMGIPVVHSGQGAMSEIAPIAVTAPEDPESYALEMCNLLDREKYNRAAETSLRAAQRHNIEGFTSVLRDALTTS